jgi:hypothetical protein
MNNFVVENTYKAENLKMSDRFKRQPVVSYDTDSSENLNTNSNDDLGKLTEKQRQSQQN